MISNKLPYDEFIKYRSKPVCLHINTRVLTYEQFVSYCNNYTNYSIGYLLKTIEELNPEEKKDYVDRVFNKNLIEQLFYSMLKDRKYFIYFNILELASRELHKVFIDCCQHEFNSLIIGQYETNIDKSRMINCLDIIIKTYKINLLTSNVIAYCLDCLLTHVNNDNKKYINYCLKYLIDKIRNESSIINKFYKKGINKYL